MKQEYHYYRNKLLAAIKYFEPDSSGNYPESAAETTSYQYDRLGNRTITEKRSGDLLASAINFQYDPLNRVISETRNINGKEYYTAYQYDQYDNLRKIKYPGSQHWLEYSYDNFNQLKGISELAGELKQTAFSYDQNGSLTGITYNSGVTTSYTLDRNSRVETIEVNRTDLNGKSESILKLNYRYDQAGNIISRNQNQYGYDSLNRLIKAEVSGTIYSERGIDHGYVEADYYGERGIDLASEGIETITLDYHSGSVGVKFRQIVRNISRIELKSIGGANHRLQAETIDLYSSYDNEFYTLIQPESWQFEHDLFGNITIRLPEGVEGQYLKIHSKFDDRDEDFRVVNQGSFTNILRELVKVYQKAEKAELSYSYDRSGNRLSKTIESKQGSMTLHSERINYHYYPGTNRLLSDGEYGYCYDQAGNLIEKGNRYSIANNTITFTARSGNGVEYYQYYYNRQNRLEKVSKNGETVARFSYDPDGKRIKAEERIKESGTTKTTYYVFAFNGQVLLEESSEHNSTSYIYAFGRTFATIAGIVGESKEISYFHYDNVGSTSLMTDQDGKIIMEQDYLPFGGDLPKLGQVEVYNEIGMEYKYTGQNQVESIGLYYYGARYYDPAIGRFITEDSYPGEINNPQSQNLYVYVMNNPLRYIDPTGHMAKPAFNDAAGGGWDDEADDVGGESAQPDTGRSSTRRNKPRDNKRNEPKNNNTEIEEIEYPFSYSYSKNWDPVKIYLGATKIENETNVEVNIVTDSEWTVSNKGEITYEKDGMGITVNKDGETTITRGDNTISWEKGRYYMSHRTEMAIEGASNNYFEVKVTSQVHFLGKVDIEGYTTIMTHNVAIRSKKGEIKIDNLTTVKIKKELRDAAYYTVGAEVAPSIKSIIDSIFKVPSYQP